LQKKRFEYAKAKTVYCQALRAAMPEMINIATRRLARPLKLDEIAAIFSFVGERQETIADRGTLFLLKRFSGNPAIEKARAEFERAREIEQIFHKDFDGIDFSLYSHTTSFASLLVRSPRKTGWRSSSSSVHSENLIPATNVGLTHRHRCITAGVIP
jgi:hypothetical protein